MKSLNKDDFASAYNMVLAPLYITRVYMIFQYRIYGLME